MKNVVTFVATILFTLLFINEGKAQLYDLKQNEFTSNGNYTIIDFYKPTSIGEETNYKGKLNITSFNLKYCLNRKTNLMDFTCISSFSFTLENTGFADIKKFKLKVTLKDKAGNTIYNKTQLYDKFIVSNPYKLSDNYTFDIFLDKSIKSKYSFYNENPVNLSIEYLGITIDAYSTLNKERNWMPNEDKENISSSCGLKEIENNYDIIKKHYKVNYLPNIEAWLTYFRNKLDIAKEMAISTIKECNIPSFSWSNNPARTKHNYVVNLIEEYEKNIQKKLYLPKDSTYWDWLTFGINLNSPKINYEIIMNGKVLSNDSLALPNYSDNSDKCKVFIKCFPLNVTEFIYNKLEPALLNTNCVFWNNNYITFYKIVFKLKNPAGSQFYRVYHYCYGSSLMANGLVFLWGDSFIKISDIYDATIDLKYIDLTSTN